MLLHVEPVDKLPPRRQRRTESIHVQTDAGTSATDQLTGEPARLDDVLGPRSPDRVVGLPCGLELVRRLDLAEDSLEDHRVLDGLAGARALPRRHGMRGVAHHADAAFEIGRSRPVFPLRIDEGLGAVEK